MVVTVPGGARGQRLDQFLAQAVAALSRSRLKSLIDSESVTIDGKAAKAASRLKGGERIELTVPAPTPAEVVAQPIALHVVYEDADVLVIDKAAGMVVHPGAGNPDGTLVNALLHRVRDLKGVGGVLRPGIVHRLDKDTSGLMVVAKHDAALEALQRAFAAREVDKVYLALVRGQPPAQGTFRTLYGRHPKHRMRFTGKVKQGKPAVTHFHTVRQLRDASLVEVTLETGRTHQIRVHFAEAGYPLLADELYGGRRAPKAPIERQALHAWRLTFAHPVNGKRLSFEAKVPPDFAQALAALSV